MGDIYSRIVAVMSDCGAVAKDAYNPQQKYKYRGIDAVMNALNPAMSKNGIFVSPRIIDLKREERESRNGSALIYSVVTVEYTFYSEDGSSITAIVTGEGMDSGDKSINKAMSAAFKYACFQVFCIPTEEMKDSEQDSPEPASKKSLKEKAEAVASSAIGKERAEIIKKKLQEDGIDPEYAAKCCKVSDLAGITDKQHSWIVNHTEELKKNYEAWKQNQG